MIVWSRSASLCAVETNSASYWLQGKYTPRWIICQKKRPKRGVSHLAAVGQSVTGEGLKKSVNILPTLAIQCGVPVDSAAARRPASSSALFASSRSYGGFSRQRAERGDAGRGGEGVTAERAGLKNFAGGEDMLHDFGSAAVGADGQAAPDDFAKRGQVGPDAEPLLGAAEGQPKTGHHFITHEQGAMLLSEVVQSSQKLRRWNHHAHVAAHRFKHHGGDLVAFARKWLLVQRDRCTAR